jgi:two-component system cell cycle response regulator
MTTADRAKILVADDDEGLLNTLTWILKDRGYEVVPVSDSGSLIDRMLDERPDLLMLDIMMPKVDGLQILEKIKTDERWRDLPVLMISSMSPEDGTVKALGLGASDFIPKPFRVKELLARVDAHLRTSRALREARQEAREQAAEAKARAEEAAIRAEMVDILHEVTDALKAEEIYHILARRVAHVLDIAKCSLVIPQSDGKVGLVVVTSDNPMLRNLEIQLDGYPEIRRALETNQPVLVGDVDTDPLYSEVRQRWERDGISVTTKSVIAIPFHLHGAQSGVFFLRTTDQQTPLTLQDVAFAEQVIKTAINAIEKAYQLETVQSDKERYRWLASIDALTGCLNRRAFMERVDRELDRVRRYGIQLSILMIDLDRFKEVNDSRGHLVGDTVLRQLGDLLRREVRSVDLAARYGGEEFIIVLPDTTPEGAMIFAERLRKRVLSRNFAEAGDPLNVTVSIGVANVTRDAGDLEPDDIIAKADEALYRAKNDGRNRVRE